MAPSPHFRLDRSDRTCLALCAYCQARELRFTAQAATAAILAHLLRAHRIRAG